MSCATLVGLEGICGKAGDCVLVERADNVNVTVLEFVPEFTCACSSDFYFQSTEFLFLEDEAADFRVVPCNTSKIGILSLYAVALLLNILGLLAYSCSMKRKSQAKRLIPYFLACLLGMVPPIVKFVDININIGENFLVTAAVALPSAAVTITNRTFLSKFLSYLYKTLQIKPKRLGNKLNKIEKLLKVNEAISVITCLLFLSTPFLSRSSETLHYRAKTFRAVFFLMALTLSVGGTSEVYLLEKMKSDIKLLVSKEDGLRPLLNSICGIQKMAILQVVDFSFMISSAFSLSALHLWRYYTPIFVINRLFTTIVILKLNLKAKKASKYKRHKNGKSSNNSKTKESSKKGVIFVQV